MHYQNQIPGQDFGVEIHMLSLFSHCSCNSQTQEWSKEKMFCFCQYWLKCKSSHWLLEYMISLPLESSSVCWRIWWTWMQWELRLIAVKNLKNKTKEKSQSWISERYCIWWGCVLHVLTGCRSWMLSLKLPMNVIVLILCERRGILPKATMNLSSSDSSAGDRPSRSKFWIIFSS